jgi:hypothetical protein
LEFLEKSLEKSLLNFIFKNLYYFVKVFVENLPKYVIFKVFQIHLQVSLMFKSGGYKSFYTTFEGPNVHNFIFWTFIK